MESLLSPPPALIPRAIAPAVREALDDTRVVLVAGPRQAGKTTLVRQLAGDDRSYFTLDDLTTLAAVRADPVGFVRGLGFAIIDEIQRAPDLILAIKESVDRDQTPGRFLLTGSANLSTLPMVADSLAGRMEVITLLPLSQAEIEGRAGRFIERTFAGDIPLQAIHPVIDGELIERVLAGGYAEALRRKSIGRRQKWLEDYARLILDRDARDIAAIDQLERLPRLLAVLAEQAGQLTNHSSYGSALGLSDVTARKYVGILERLFLITTLQPWSGNHLSRLVKTPKIHFLDSGLLAMLRGMSPDSVARDRTRFGALLESFVVSEVMKLSTWSAIRPAFYHYRTKDQDEVDLVLEDRRGRIVGIEVKASATVTQSDFRGLRQLKEALGERFACGLVLHDSDRATPFGENLYAAPVSYLWQI